MGCGAGNGSIAIEWLRLSPSGTAIAIEGSRVENARFNAELSVPGLKVIKGEAPMTFSDLTDDPDAIFVAV